MDVKIYPSCLKGGVEVISSKSVAHRLLICSMLADGPTKIKLNALSDDITATAEVIKALGLSVERTDDGFIVTPSSFNEKVEINCKESGSTLRFILPVLSALNISATVKGEGRLPDRPLKDLTNILKGVTVVGERLPVKLSGKLLGGEFRLRGDISSQYVSGLMFALPLLLTDSKIIIDGEMESKPYLNLTVDALKQFNVSIEETDYGYFIKGGQKYLSPKTVAVEGDWSNASYFFLANSIGHDLSVLGLNEDSLQGDKVIKELLAKIKNGGAVISVKNCPDLVPSLAVASCFVKGRTTITDAKRLRLKESDRLKAVTNCLTALGGKVQELEDGLIIDGAGLLKGGEIESFNDHRIVMSMAIASTLCEGATVIKNAQAVNKSYPQFFEILRRLGGRIDVI